MKQIALILFLMCTFALRARADDARFEKANQEFAAGNYQAATADYSGDVGDGLWSANLFYNLGNAYFREGDLGRAILNYDRALQIDAHHPEAEANLRLARDQTRGLELTPSPLEKFIRNIRTSTWIVATAILFWLAVILLVWRPRGKFLAGAATCLFVSAACGWMARTQENGVHGQGAAIVVAENAEARVATADTARSILLLPPGSEVVILQQRGDWNYAMLPNNQRGWIPAKAAESVRL